MTVTYRSSGSFVGYSFSNYSITIPKPSGLQVNDLMLNKPITNEWHIHFRKRPELLEKIKNYLGE